MACGGDRKSNKHGVSKSDSATKYLAFGIEKDLGEEFWDNESADNERTHLLREPSRPMTMPKGGVAMAVFLTIGGAYLMVYGLLVVAGFCVPKHTDGMWFRVALGVLTFIPGVYHVRLALFAYLDVPGYSYEDFPNF